MKRGTRMSLAVTLLAGLLVAGCGGGKDGDGTKSYAFVTTGVAGFWDICKKGAEDAAKEIGVEVEVLMPSSADDQKQKIEGLVARGVDGIAVAAIDPANQTDLFNEVAERMPFITADTDAPDSDRLVYVGMDNYKAGRMAGELVKEALPDGGEVIIFIGRLEQDNAKRRRQGVIDELLDRSEDPSRYDPPGGGPLAGDKYTVLATLTDQFDRAKAKANVEDMLTKHQNVGCMVGLFEYNPISILAALEQANKLNEVKVVGFDENEATLQGIIDGKVYGTVVQNPYEYGKQSIKLLHEIASGDTSGIPESKFIDIPARQVRQDNVEAFWAELKKNLGQE